MSLFDKIAAAVAPPESDEDRAVARRTSEALARPGGWLATALEHHRRIESCFELARRGATSAERQSALKELGRVLTGHANAEESVIYPAIAEHGEKAHAVSAYGEQAMAKIEMAALEKLDPMSQEWTDKLDHIRGAVLHHVYEEEGTWFPELQRALAGADEGVLSRRFTEEFEKYAGGPDQASFRAEHPQQMAAQIPPTRG